MGALAGRPASQVSSRGDICLRRWRHVHGRGASYVGADVKVKDVVDVRIRVIRVNLVVGPTGARSAGRAGESNGQEKRPVGFGKQEVEWSGSVTRTMVLRSSPAAFRQRAKLERVPTRAREYKQESATAAVIGGPGE